MKKRLIGNKNKNSLEKTSTKKVLLIVVASIIGIFVIIPLFLSLFNQTNLGNVAIIPIEGPIIVGGSSFGEITASSKEIVSFINDAADDPVIEAIILDINSPGGSAVASDEIATAIKKTDKPVVSVIREVGASGGYWIASSSDYIIANRMSITGSIGVISSYLEFSGLMEKYGISYERLVAGKYKDVGTPFKDLGLEEKNILQGKLNKIHDFFISEVAENRNLPIENVKNLATGEFYLGVEALQSGLIDEIGDIDSAKEYLINERGLEFIEPVVYQQEVSFFSLLTGVFADFSFNMGQGLGAIFINENTPNGILLN